MTPLGVSILNATPRPKRRGTFAWQLIFSFLLGWFLRLAAGGLLVW